MRMRAIVVAVLVVIVALAIAVEAQSKVPTQSLPDLHIGVEAVAHSVGGSDSLHKIESRFTENHDKVMSKLDKVLRRVTHFQRDSKIDRRALVEVDAETAIEGERKRKRKHRRNGNDTGVIIDGTGGDSYTPRANLTRFTVKPKVSKKFRADVFLEVDEEINRKRRRKHKQNNGSVIIDNTGSLPIGAPTANLTRFNQKPKIVAKGFIPDVFVEIVETMDKPKRRKHHKKNNSSVIIDGTGSLSHTPQVNTTRFKIKPKIKERGFVPDVLTEIDSSIERKKRKHKHKNNSSVIVDGTGSLSHTPQANTTRFKIKPKIKKKGFVLGSLVEIEAQESRKRRKKSSSKVVIDGTGSIPVGSPKVNLKKFNKKAKIVKQFKIDPALVPTAAPVKPRSLVETHVSSEECPTCKNGVYKQDHPVIINPVSYPNPHEAGIRQEQQNAINHLIKPVENSLSIKQAHLDHAHATLKEADGTHDRFQEFKQIAQNTPLVPQ